MPPLIILDFAARPEQSGLAAKLFTLNSVSPTFNYSTISQFVPNTVLFKKPPLKTLVKEYACVDMHFHTRASDGRATVERLLPYAKKLGVGVAVTDHNEISAALAAYANQDGVLVIPGIEIGSLEQKDFLVYFSDPKQLKDFYERHVKKFRNPRRYSDLNKPMLRILDEAGKYDCLIAAAHPYALLWKNLGKFALRQGFGFIEKVDLIEAFNAALSKKRNRTAVALAERFQKNVCGGSDGHTLRELGVVVTCARAKIAAEFLRQLKAGNSFVIGRRCRFSHIIAKDLYLSAKLTKHYYPDTQDLGYFGKQEAKITKRKSVVLL